MAAVMGLIGSLTNRGRGGGGAADGFLQLLGGAAGGGGGVPQELEVPLLLRLPRQELGRDVLKDLLQRTHHPCHQGHGRQCLWRPCIHKLD